MQSVRGNDSGRKRFTRKKDCLRAEDIRKSVHLILMKKMRNSQTLPFSYREHLAYFPFVQSNLTIK